MNCPNCESENIQSIQAICLGGEPNSNLVKSLNKIHIESEADGCALYFISGFFLLVSILGGFDSNEIIRVVSFVIGLVSFVVIYEKYQKQKDNKSDFIRQYRHNELYDSGWYCHKCSHKWLPEKK